MRREERMAAQLVAELLGYRPEAFLKVRRMGGITNENYYLATENEELMLRLPGQCTELIDRAQEEQNAQVAARAGLNPETLYFSAETGIKITRYISGARALTSEMAAQPELMTRTAALLHRLHWGLPAFENRFDPQALFSAYLEPEYDRLAVVFENLEGARATFFDVCAALEEMQPPLCPCHNDPLAENLVLDSTDRLWLIDWEYSGQNDPFWDVAAHLLESEFTPVQQQRFLREYLGRPATREEQRRVLLLQIAQDLLWSVQTMVKTLAGEDQFDYAKGRYVRAGRLLAVYRGMYGALS